MAISKGEIRLLTGNDSNGKLLYVITASQDKSCYYIYDKDLKKLGKGKSPPELEKKYFNI